MYVQWEQQSPLQSSVLCCCSVSVHGADWEDGSAHWTLVWCCCLKRNLTPPENVFADLQWLNVSPCCSEVQVDSRTRWHHCWVWLQVQQSTLSDIIQPHLSVMLRSEVKRASDRLNFILRFSGLFICPLFGLSLHHFLPSAFLFLLHLFVLMISVYGAQLNYRKVKPTLHSQHASWCECILVNEQTALSHGAPICFHISSSEWSHVFFSQCSPKFSNISWRPSHWHPKVCWRTQTLRAGNEL